MEWIAVVASVIAAVTALFAAVESRRTRREATHPPAVPTILSFTRYEEEEFEVADDGSPLYWRALTRYRVSFVNDGTRPVRILDLGYEIRRPGLHSGTTRGFKRDEEWWDIVSHPDVPTTVAPSDGIDFSYTWPHANFPGDMPEPAIGRAFADVAGQQRVYVGLVDGDPDRLFT